MYSSEGNGKNCICVLMPVKLNMAFAAIDDKKCEIK
jgi:hypothetical protein